MSGSSAGAITSFLVGYGEQKDWDAVSPAISEALGPANSSGNKLTETFELQGISNRCGSVQPFLLEGKKLIPTVSFHGELDDLVPIGKSDNGLGSRAIHEILNEEDVCNDLSVDLEAGHNIYGTPEGYLFMIDRAACFFKSLMCDTCTSFMSTEQVPSSCSN